jgi:dTDP-L-rhamnose 4-epimerase
MTKNVLITGGAGFIGSNLSLKLIENGWHVTVLDNLSAQIHGEMAEDASPLFRNIKNEVNFIKGTVTSFEDWRQAINGQDAIIHLAAETGTGQSMYEIERYVNVNIAGTAIMLNILANDKHTIKKIIVASSRAIYGEGKYECNSHGFVYPLERKDSDMAKGNFDCKCPLCNGKLNLCATSEDSKIQPTSIYGITKQTQEQMVLVTGKSLSIPAVALRYQNVYGPGQSLINPYTGILSIFSSLIKNNKKINVFEDGKESRDFVFIDDAVSSTLLALEKENANFHVFNVGYGQPVDVITVSNTLKQIYNSDIEIVVSGNYRLGDIRHNYADITKIKKLLDFNPQWSFEKGINKFCDWVNQQTMIENNYEKSIQFLKERKLFK